MQNETARLNHDFAYQEVCLPALTLRQSGFAFGFSGTRALDGFCGREVGPVPILHPRIAQSIIIGRIHMDTRAFQNVFRLSHSLSSSGLVFVWDLRRT